MHPRISSLKLLMLSVAAILAWAAPASSAHAQLLAYEGFDYAADTSLASQNGGTGWVGAWSSVIAGSGTALVEDPGFSYGALEVSGNHAVITPTNAITYSTRSLAQSFNTGTIYLSLLAQNLNEGTRGGGLILRSTDAQIGFVGQLNGTTSWGINATSGGTSTTQATTNSALTLSLLVLKIEFDFNDTFDRLSLLVNPTPGGPEPGSWDAVVDTRDIGTLAALRLQSGFATSTLTTTVMGIDELRIGNTFADVTPFLGNYWAPTSSGGEGVWSADNRNWAVSPGVAGGGRQTTNNEALIFSGTGGEVEISGTVAAAAGLTFSNNGYVLTNGTVNLTGTNTAANTITTGEDVGATIASVLSGSQGMTKSGQGTLTLSGTNSYSGTTAVEAGTLVVNGSITNSATTVQSGAVLGGSGAVGATTILSGGTIAPGESPGTLTNIGNLTWSGGGSYDWEIFNVTGPPGTEWDLIRVTDQLLFADLSATNTFAINIFSLSALPATPGPLAGWNPSVDSSWTILSATNGISGFNAANFTLNLANFTNNNSLSGGLFSLAQDGGELKLMFTAASGPGPEPIPEPATWLAAALLASLAVYVRRKRLRVSAVCVAARNGPYIREAESPEADPRPTMVQLKNHPSPFASSQKVL
jgi:autotransporter-associated beta strand protein